MSTSSTIGEELYKQSQGMDITNFICDTCVNYKGRCACEKNIFIAFVGANLNHCHAYKQGRKCPHCGRIS